MDIRLLDSISDRKNLEKNPPTQEFLVDTAVFRNAKCVGENNVSILQKVFIL